MKGGLRVPFVPCLEKKFQIQNIAMITKFHPAILLYCQIVN